MSAELQTVRTFSASSGITSTQLAESVYHEFKTKVQSLKSNLDDKDAAIQHLHQVLCIRKQVW